MRANWNASTPAIYFDFNGPNRCLPSARSLMPFKMVASIKIFHEKFRFILYFASIARNICLNLHLNWRKQQKHLNKFVRQRCDKRSKMLTAKTALFSSTAQQFFVDRQVFSVPANVYELCARTILKHHDMTHDDCMPFR